MNRRNLIILVVAVVLVVGFGLWWWASGSVSTDDAQIDGPLSPISARVSGNVIAVAVHDGQMVKAGDVLVQIDPKDYEVAVAKARLEAAKARVTQAQANADRAAQDLARYKSLVDKDEISRQQYDAAVAAATANQAEAEAQKASLVEAQQNVIVAQQFLDQTGARVEQAKANFNIAGTGPQLLAMKQAKEASAAAVVAQKQALLEQAQLNLSYCKITAPVDGVVGKKSVDVGANVAPGQQLMAVVPLSGFYVTANFKETELRHMQVGQKANISVDSTGQTLHGVVEAIGGATGARYSLLPPENATGNYVKVVQRIPVRIKLDPNEDREQRLRLGMSVVPKVYVR